MFNPSTCVYHYTSAAKCLDFILPGMSLRMGSFENLNDPREAKTWPFRFYSRASGSFDRSWFHAATEAVTKRSLMLSCSRNVPGADPGDVLALGFGHPRMWAQYGDGHRGVCLALDQVELDSAVRLAAGVRPVFSGPVEYYQSGHGPSSEDGNPYDIAYLEDVETFGIDAVMEPHIARFNRELFFTKHLDWRDESEFRWVVRSSDVTQLFVPVGTSIRAVLVGHDCPVEQLETIVELCRPAGIPVHRLYWHGWAASLFGDVLDPEGVEGISLNGISFSTQIPCSSVYAQACDQDGNVRTIEIRSSGEVVPLD